MENSTINIVLSKEEADALYVILNFNLIGDCSFKSQENLDLIEKIQDQIEEQLN